MITREDGRVKVTRTAGYGPVYIPEARKVINEGEEYYLPYQEAYLRVDWDIVLDEGEELPPLMSSSYGPAKPCCPEG